MPIHANDRRSQNRRLYQDVARIFGRAAEDDFGGKPKPATPHLVTLDTSVIRDYWGERPRKWAIDRLLELARGTAVDLVVTRYIEQDVPRSPLKERIDELPSLLIGKTGGLLTFGASAFFGSSDFFASGAFEQCQQAFASWRPSRGKPPDARDWNHLHAHYAQRRDYFLTWDEPLIELGSILEAGFSLGVIPPDEYLNRRNEGHA